MNALNPEIYSCFYDFENFFWIFDPGDFEILEVSPKIAHIKNAPYVPIVAYISPVSLCNYHLKKLIKPWIARKLTENGLSSGVPPFLKKKLWLGSYM